jgi:tRNA pseudouridine32 synthase / 23S rRNA pseudouridine746 synthase
VTTTDSSFFHPIELPDSVVEPTLFRSPFAPQPAVIAQHAATLLQRRLVALKQDSTTLDELDQMGKMFGVLVVRNQQNKIGYLAGFSGKLANTNHHIGFVPPVFDILTTDGFYKQGEADVNVVNARIAELRSDLNYHSATEELRQLKADFGYSLLRQKEKARINKEARNARRNNAQTTTQTVDLEMVAGVLEQESKLDHFTMRDLKRVWNERISAAQSRVDQYSYNLSELLTLRAQMSRALQERIFRAYTFLNAHQQSKNLVDIFGAISSMDPPAGAGECTAPKLFQFAYENQLQPIAIAEFWWGATSLSEVRMTGQFYPACRSKCWPILGHMLDGLQLEPYSNQVDAAHRLLVLYEDDVMAAILKPSGMLSVPGKEVQESVTSHVKMLFPMASGPMIVHRLDQATSGVMLIAKTDMAYKVLQDQFTKRVIKKRYIAVLQGVIPQVGGRVELPLRVDLDDRPRQMVCHTYGKSALTLFTVLGRDADTTRVRFEPVTGRTHQLRVHAAHALGLNAPIKGDDLYGSPSDRLYLHAEWIAFQHPISGEKIEIESKAPF